jgi:membrane protein
MRTQITGRYAQRVKLERLTRGARVGVPLSVLTDAAAALTYYTVLSLFPGLALLVSALALIGGEQEVIEIIGEIAPPSVTATLVEPIDSLTADKSLSAAALGLSAALSLFSASRYVAAFGRAADRIQGFEPGRGPFWSRRPLAMLLVGAIIVLLPLALLALLITGPIAAAVAQSLGLSSTVRDLFQILRWPLLGILGASMLTILYLSSEEMRRAGPLRMVPGALVAIGIWLLTSGLFSAFIANLTSFSLVYGGLAGVVVFLIWLYVSNLAVLAGLVVNAIRLGTIGPPAGTGDEGDPVGAPG